MNPLELRPKDQWEKILKRFARDTKMTACLTDDTGAQLLCAGDRYPLCAAVREKAGALMSICSQVNTAMLAVIKRSLEPELDFCDAGLIRVVVPIVKDGQLIGQITACGLASEHEELDSFLLSKEVGITEDEALELVKAAPFGSDEELEKLCARLFEEL